MKHGPRCEACRVSMVYVVQKDAAGAITDECYECPECGHSFSINPVRIEFPKEPRYHPIEIQISPAEWFERMRDAADATLIDGEVSTSSVHATPLHERSRTARQQTDS